MYVLLLKAQVYLRRKSRWKKKEEKRDRGKKKRRKREKIKGRKFKAFRFSVQLGQTIIPKFR